MGQGSRQAVAAMLVASLAGCAMPATITLKDGRRLSYAEYGTASGRPVFHFHGSGGSRMERPLDESILNDLGIRFISVDRPGHGFSDHQADRKLLDMPDDITALADHLGLRDFYVLGWSAGGPYALACAYKMPDRVRRGAIVSGFAPPDRPGATKGYSFFAKLFMLSARYFPWFTTQLRKMGYSQVRSGKDISVSCMLEPDQKIMRVPGNYERYVADVREGYRQGWEGVAKDDRIILTPWGFDLREIPVHFDVWQGELDQNVPVSHGEYQNRRLAHSTLRIVKGEGHLYLLSHWRQILSELTRQ